MRVVAIVPAYQAAASVGSVVSELVRLWPASAGPAAVIVVDDGSNDETATRADAAGAMVVRHRRNRGKGAALRTGLVRALDLGAEAAVTVDADGQHPAAEALRLAVHDVPATTLVLAVRDLASAGAPRSSQFSNRISNVFLSRFSGAELRDTQCGLRRYPVVGTLELGASSDGFAYEAEVVLRAARAGWSIEQVPVRVFYPPPEERVSHFHVVRDPARIIGTVLRTLADTARPR
jgi:glycosyltransferase involved in cell wall biosynthesis